MVTPWQKNRAKLAELEQRIAALEQQIAKQEQEGLAIPADIVSEWLNGKSAE
jgi:uncharacterized coiled-coil protein SlyX